MILPDPSAHGATTIGVDLATTPATRTRLSPAEKARTRAFISLRAKDYEEASRQFTALRGLDPNFRSEETEILCEAISLLLAIKDEIHLLEGSAVR